MSMTGPDQPKYKKNRKKEIYCLIVIDKITFFDNIAHPQAQKISLSWYQNNRSQWKVPAKKTYVSMSAV